MKKYIYIILAATAALSLSSCQKEVGTLAGNDTAPHAVLTTFAPGDEYDSDCDVAVRFTANDVTTGLYYLAEKTADKNARNMSDEQYADYVVSNGTKVTTSVNQIDGSQSADVVLQSLFGDNTISVVASNGSAKHLASTTFSGLQWVTLATGTFSSGRMSALGVPASKTILQKCEQLEGTYRFKDLYKTGYHYVFKTQGKAQTDADGDTFYYVTVAGQEIGLTYGSYGNISVRDVATWQGNEAYLQYNTFYPDYNYVIIWAQYYVSAGSLGYDDDIFTADE